MMSAALVTGKVIRFDEVRGYGFVAPDVGAEDVFLHVNDLTFDKRLLTQGARVRFVIEEGDRGLKASQVQMIDDGASPVSSPVSAAAALSHSGDDDGLCDILSTAELTTELTESLVTSVPTITAEQIVKVRQCVARIAQTHGWIED